MADPALADAAPLIALRRVTKRYPGIVANDSIKRSGKAYEVLAESLAPESYGVGFRKGDLALRDAVQSALEAMAKDGTVAKITAKWFGSDISIVGK